MKTNFLKVVAISFMVIFFCQTLVYAGAQISVGDGDIVRIIIESDVAMEGERVGVTDYAVEFTLGGDLYGVRYSEINWECPNEQGYTGLSFHTETFVNGEPAPWPEGMENDISFKLCPSLIRYYGDQLMCIEPLMALVPDVQSAIAIFSKPLNLDMGDVIVVKEVVVSNLDTGEIYGSVNRIELPNGTGQKLNAIKGDTERIIKILGSGGNKVPPKRK